MFRLPPAMIKCILFNACAALSCERNLADLQQLTVMLKTVDWNETSIVLWKDGTTYPNSTKSPMVPNTSGSVQETACLSHIPRYQTIFASRFIFISIVDIARDMGALLIMLIPATKSVRLEKFRA